jgi:hypothetical protein
LEGDRVAFITRSQVELDERLGLICTLDIGAARSHLPVGVRLRHDCHPSNTLRSFLGHLERSGTEFDKTH